MYDRYLTGAATPQDQIALDRWATTAQRRRLLRAEGESQLPSADRTERALVLLRGRLGWSARSLVRWSGGRQGAVVKRRGGRGVYLGSRALRAGLWIGVTAAVIGGVVALTRRAPESSSDVTRVYATNASQQAIVNLDDGTRVTLAPQTTLRLRHFGAQSRTVMLEAGEAYFEVTHASGMPFIVRSGEATATVLGTAFLLRHPAGDPHVYVAVTDGKVHVTPTTRTGSGVTGVTLTRGQAGNLIDSTTHVSTVDDLAPGTEWAPGYIIFRDTPVATVLQTVSQWYGYHFRYADPTVGAQSVTLTVSTRSSAEALAAIERVLEVNLTVAGDTVTLVPQPPRASGGAPRIRTYDVWTPMREVGR